MLVSLCSDRHISVVADAIICHVTSEEVIKYIMDSDVGDMRNKTLPMAVGVCLFKANHASWRACDLSDHEDVYDANRFFTYIDTTLERRYSHIELLNAVNGFCAHCALCGDNRLSLSSTVMLLNQLCNKLLGKISGDPKELTEEYAKANTWFIF